MLTINTKMHIFKNRFRFFIFKKFSIGEKNIIRGNPREVCMATHYIKCEGKNNVLFRKINVDSFNPSTTIIVPDTHNAIIVKDGIALETLPAGRHKIFDSKKGFLSLNSTEVQTVDVIFVSKTTKLNILWGTTTQYDMRDPNTGASIKLGMSGEMEIQICNPRKAYLELIGQDEDFGVDNLKERLQGRLLAEVQYQIANIMNTKMLSYDRLGEVLLPIGNEVLPHIANLFEKDYGLKVFSFTISRIIISDEDIEKISTAKGQQIAREIKNKEKENEYLREMDLRKLEREDYAKYLEVCRIVGWPTSKKETKTGECPNCGVKISADMKFCPVCGTEIKQTKIKCPNCGKMITKDDMFCKHCGAKVRD